VAPPVADAWAADEASIRAQLQGSEDAWNRGDLPGHLAPYDENVTFMTKNGPRPGIAAVEAAFAEKYFLDGVPKQTLRFEQLTVRQLDEDAALAIGRFVLSGGTEPEQSGWFSTIWVRGPEGWVTVHDHSS
jgi:ketosteroid isomerase-like protein